jgi:uncharacterized protein YqeY
MEYVPGSAAGHVPAITGGGDKRVKGTHPGQRNLGSFTGDSTVLDRRGVELNELHLSIGCRERGILMDAGALEAIISKQMITALKAHDAERTGTLRLIMTSLKNKSIEKRAPLTPAEEQQALATMIKQRRDSIDLFTKGNRPELAAKEAAEIVVIEEFLPKALDEAGLKAMVDEAIAAQTAEAGQKPTPKEMGQVIKRVQSRLQASGVRAEGRLVSEVVKAALAS